MSMDADPPFDRAVPRWIAPSLDVNEGRDPLGLQTTTQDRLMPLLLPGILELTRRARYFSFYAFLLAEYQARRWPANRASLSKFIKQREWEFGLAVLRCPHDCGSSPVGARKLGSAWQGDGPFRRGESVESDFGGYGLYYRSPLIELGIVARAGTMLGDAPTSIDVLYNTHRAGRLADTFKHAVEHTAYYKSAMLLTTDLPAEVVDEYAAAACLCQLQVRHDERLAVHDALFGSDPVSSAGSSADAPSDTASPTDGSETGELDFREGVVDLSVSQRRRSVAHYLTLVAGRPGVVEAEGAYRDAMWESGPPRSEEHAVVAGQWAALIAKDIWQEALCSVWSEFGRSGLARMRELDRGLTWDEVREVAQNLAVGSSRFASSALTKALIDELNSASLVMHTADGVSLPISTSSLEELRHLTTSLDTAVSGLVVLLELGRRAATNSGPGWKQASRQSSAWQPSVASVLSEMEAHLATGPTVGDTMWWLVSRFILPVHERIAYSKMPEFTFRFRWEDGLLNFYDLGIGRFPLAAIRREPLALLTRDLDLWDWQGDDVSAGLTARGKAFVIEVLG